MDHFKKLSVALYVTIGLILALLVAMICYTGSVETAKAFDGSYEFIDFDDTLSIDSTFPFNYSSVYYNSSSRIIDYDDSLTIESNSSVTNSNGFRVYCASGAVLLSSFYSITLNNNTMLVNKFSSSDGLYNLYFQPYSNINLVNTDDVVYLNFIISCDNLNYFYFNPYINGAYTGGVRSLEDTSYTGGFVYKWSYSNTTNNFLRLVFSSDYDIYLGCVISNKPYDFVLSDGENILENDVSYSSTLTDTGDGFVSSIDFNLGSSITVNDLNYWTYLYWKSIFDYSSPVFVASFYFSNTYYSIPMYRVSPQYGISDTTCINITGNFTFADYVYYIEFFNCNYDGNEFLYDYSIQIYCLDTSLDAYSFTFSNFTLIQYNNIVNNQSYKEGYNLGYNNGYSSGYYSGGKDANKDYNTGYALGYTTGLEVAEDGSFLGLFVAAIESPLQAILSMFDVEILGYNMKSLYMALISLALVLFIVRLIMTGSKGKSD